MKMSGEQFIPAPRTRVWEALNDPEVLRQSIPGCQELEKTSPTSFAAKVTAKVGPVKANFAGDVGLSDINAPESYVISGQGKGGAAGFAKGAAHVRLEEQDGGTKLLYDVDAQVGGKLAQIGSRLIDSTARKMADDFFGRFNAVVTGREPKAEAETAPAPAPEPAPAAMVPAAGSPAGKPAKKPAKKVAKKSAKKAAAQPAQSKAAATRTDAKSTAKGQDAGKPEAETAGQGMQAPASLMPEAAVAASATRPNQPDRKPPEAQPFWAGNGMWWIVGVAILALILIILATS